MEYVLDVWQVYYDNIGSLLTRFAWAKTVRDWATANAPTNEQEETITL